jgi:DNA-binding transcriptional ArsR family regulator
MLRWMALIWQIPKEALRLRRIEPVKTAAVLLALADEAGPDGWCRVPMERLCRKAHMSPREVSRVMAALEEARLIRRGRRRGCGFWRSNGCRSWQALIHHPWRMTFDLPVQAE